MTSMIHEVARKALGPDLENALKHVTQVYESEFSGLDEEYVDSLRGIVVKFKKKICGADSSTATMPSKGRKKRFDNAELFAVHFDELKTLFFNDSYKKRKLIGEFVERMVDTFRTQGDQVVGAAFKEETRVNRMLDEVNREFEERDRLRGYRPNLAAREGSRILENSIEYARRARSHEGSPAATSPATSPLWSYDRQPPHTSPIPSTSKIPRSITSAGSVGTVQFPSDDFQYFSRPGTGSLLKSGESPLGGSATGDIPLPSDTPVGSLPGRNVSIVLPSPGLGEGEVLPFPMPDDEATAGSPKASRARTPENRSGPGSVRTPQRTSASGFPSESLGRLSEAEFKAMRCASAPPGELPEARMQLPRSLTPTDGSKSSDIRPPSIPMRPPMSMLRAAMKDRPERKSTAPASSGTRTRNPVSWQSERRAATAAASPTRGGAGYPGQEAHRGRPFPLLMQDCDDVGKVAAWESEDPEGADELTPGPGGIMERRPVTSKELSYLDSKPRAIRGNKRDLNGKSSRDAFKSPQYQASIRSRHKALLAEQYRRHTDSPASLSNPSSLLDSSANPAAEAIDSDSPSPANADPGEGVAGDTTERGGGSEGEEDSRSHTHRSRGAKRTMRSPLIPASDKGSPAPMQIHNCARPATSPVPRFAAYSVSPTKEKDKGGHEETKDNPFLTNQNPASMHVRSMLALSSDDAGGVSGWSSRASTPAIASRPSSRGLVGVSPSLEQSLQRAMAAVDRSQQGLGATAPPDPALPQGTDGAGDAKGTKSRGRKAKDPDSGQSPAAGDILDGGGGGGGDDGGGDGGRVGGGGGGSTLPNIRNRASLE